MRDSNHLKILEAFVWLPYKNSCGHVKYVKRIFKWTYSNGTTTCDSLQVVNLNKIWKIPHNLNQCPLRISSFHWPPFMIFEGRVPMAGIEFSIVQAIAEHLNMSLNILPPEANRWEGEPCDAKWGALLGDLHYQISDLAIASLSLTKQRITLFDYTISYMRTSLGWIVREAEEIPRWKNPFRILNPTAWTLLFLSYILTAFVVYIKYGNMALRLFGILLGIAVPIDRQFWLPLWMIYSLIINMAYQTFLISFLTEPAREAPIKSLSQVIKVTV